MAARWFGNPDCDWPLYSRLLAGRSAAADLGVVATISCWGGATDGSARGWNRKNTVIGVIPMHVAIDLKNLALYAGGIVAFARPLVAAWLAHRPDFRFSLVAPDFDTSAFSA